MTEFVGTRPRWNGTDLALATEVGGVFGTTTVTFTDGDLRKRCTVADANVLDTSRIIITARRPDILVDDDDEGFLYFVNVVNVYAGGFDIVVVCTGPGFDDMTIEPPNETLTLYYQVA